MGFIKVILITSTLMALLAFYARPQFPDTATNRTLKTAIGLGAKIVKFVAQCGSLLGYSPVNITRAVTDFGQRFDEQSDLVKETSIRIAGVDVILFKPKALTGKSNDGLLFIHGGGWVFMNPASYAPLLRQMALVSQSVTIAPNYRKAPEHVFPAALDDCIRVTKYFLEHAEDFGVHPDKISISGDSAGGNLALAVALHLLNEPNTPHLRALGLFYPAVQALDFNLPSLQIYERGPGFLTKRDLINYWLCYGFGHLKYYDTFYNNSHVSNKVRNSNFKEFVSRKLLPKQIQVDGDLDKLNLDNDNLSVVSISEEISTLITNSLFAPLMASDSDLAELPPTYVVTAEFDVLRDEGYLLVERLKKNNVKVKHVHLPGEEHGCMTFADFDPSMINVVKDTSDFILGQ